MHLPGSTAKLNRDRRGNCREDVDLCGARLVKIAHQTACLQSEGVQTRPGLQEVQPATSCANLEDTRALRKQPTCDGSQINLPTDGQDYRNLGSSRRTQFPLVEEFLRLLNLGPGPRLGRPVALKRIQFARIPQPSSEQDKQ